MAQIKGLDHCHFWLIISELTIIIKIKNSGQGSAEGAHGTG